MCNGEAVQREWLVYSPSTGNVYCFFCWLFGQSASYFSHSGFCDWKHASVCAEEHESRQPHRNGMLTWLAQTQTHEIDAELKEQCEEEQKYWQEVLKRVVAVIQFLSEPGLAFRGDVETIGSPNNGNYLGILNFLASLTLFLQNI